MIDPRFLDKLRADCIKLKNAMYAHDQIAPADDMSVKPSDARALAWRLIHTAEILLAEDEERDDFIEMIFATIGGVGSELAAYNEMFESKESANSCKEKEA